MEQEEVIYTDPEVLYSKIDWEGWPDALEWFATDSFEDTTLDRLVREAYSLYIQLDVYRTEIKNRLEMLVENG